MEKSEASPALKNDTEPRSQTERDVRRVNRRTEFHRPAESDELLSFEQIAQEGGPAEATQYVWASTGRYGYDKLVIKLGRLSRIPRSRYRAWLAERSVENMAAE